MTKLVFPLSAVNIVDSLSLGTICESYRPEARGYVICALPEGVARGQHMRGINHITTS